MTAVMYMHDSIIHAHKPVVVFNCNYNGCSKGSSEEALTKNNPKLTASVNTARNNGAVWCESVYNNIHYIGSFICKYERDTPKENDVFFDYKNFVYTLAHIKKKVKKDTPIAMTAFGQDYDGVGDWSTIKTLIMNILKGYNVTIYIGTSAVIRKINQFSHPSVGFVARVTNDITDEHTWQILKDNPDIVDKPHKTTKQKLVFDPSNLPTGTELLLTSPACPGCGNILSAKLSLCTKCNL